MRSYKNIIPYVLNAASKFAVPVLVIFALVTAFWLYQLRNFRFDGDFLKVLDRPTESSKVMKNLYKKFPQQTDSVLYIEYKKDVEAFEFLTFLSKLDRFVSQQEGITMDSLLNVTFLAKGGEGLKRTRPFTPSNFQGEAGSLFPQRLNSFQNFRSIYFSEDHRKFLVRFNISEPDPAKQLKALTKIKKYALSAPMLTTLGSGPSKPRLIFYGGPLTAEEISTSIQKDVVLLIPLSLLFICILVWRNFSSVRGVLLTLSCVLLTLIWSTGMMAMEGATMGIVELFLPILLLACCSSYSIYFLSQFFDGIQKSKLLIPDAVKASIYKDYVPLGISIFTTALGFTSFLLCESRSLQSMGRYLTTGLLFSAILIFFYLPAMIRVLFKDQPIQAQTLTPKKKKKTNSGVLLKISRRLFLFAAHYQNLVLVGTGLLFFFSLWTYTQLSTDFKITSLYGKKSQFSEEFKTINESFAIGADFYFVIEAPKARYFKSTAGMDVLWKAEQIISKDPRVVNTLGAPFVLRELNSDLRIGEPPTKDRVSDAFLLTSFLENNPLRSFLAPRYDVARFFVRTKLESAQELTVLARSIEETVRVALKESKDLKIYVISEKMVMNEANHGLLNEQKTSLIYASIFVSLCFLLLYRSFKIGIISLIPNIVPVCFNFLFMWLLDIPLDFSTVLIAASALGISVDDTAHIIETYLVNLKNYRYFYLRDHLQSGKDDVVHLALYKTFVEVGPAAIRTTLALMIAIGMLCLSSFEIVRNVGLCFATTLFFCLLCDLILVPALLKRFHI